MTQDNKRYPVRNIYQGNYTCKCYNCEQEFTDDKKSVLCGPCAVKLAGKINKPTDNAGQITADSHLDYITQKAKIWAEINYLEAGYKRLCDQIAQIEKDKKDMLNVIKEDLNKLQALHEKHGNNYE